MAYAEEPRIYYESPGTPERLRKGVKWLSDEAYADAMRSLIIVCADVVFHPPDPEKNRVLYLAKRVIKPAKNCPWFIGGRRRPDEEPLEAMARHLKHDTGLVVDPARYQFVQMSDYGWDTREQEPEDAGSRCLAYTYGLALEDEELAMASQNLSPEEYDPDFGLQPFGVSEIYGEKGSHQIHRVVTEVYERICMDS